MCGKHKGGVRNHPPPANTCRTKKLRKRKMKKLNTLTLAAMIAACYVVVTVALAPISFGEVQFRISEALTILPLFTPAAIPGLFIGCLIGNALGGAVLPDIIFGSLATLLGAIGTYFVGQSFRGGFNNHAAAQGIKETEGGPIIENNFARSSSVSKPRLNKISPIVIGTIPPIIANAVIVPFVLKYAYGSPLPIPFMMLTVGIGEVISCGILGTILGIALSRNVVNALK